MTCERLFLSRLQTYKLNFLRKWGGFLTVSIPSANIDLAANNWFFLRSTNATSALQNQEKPMRASSSWPRNRLVMFINFSFFSLGYKWAYVCKSSTSHLILIWTLVGTRQGVQSVEHIYNRDFRFCKLALNSTKLNGCTKRVNF